jgi:hypothetical protein
MTEDDPHRICRLETKNAVVEERQAATAMALVLAEKLQAADRKFIITLLTAAIGWVFAALEIVLHK